MLSSDSHNPEYRPPLVLTDAALLEINSDDAPLLTLTAAARAEMVDAETVPLTGLLRQRLDEFRAARRTREQARGKELLKAMEIEDKAALMLAWTLDQDAEKAVSSC